MKNPTTTPAIILRRFTKIPVAESYLDDDDRVWARCPRCGSYHTHQTYTQGLVSAPCELDDPFAKADVPPIYYLEIDGFALAADLRRYEKFNKRRQRERNAVRQSLAKQEAFRLKIEASRRK